MSSCFANSTTAVPSLKTSAKRTSPAWRMWSFRSCHEPEAGKFSTTIRCEDLRGGLRRVGGGEYLFLGPPEFDGSTRMRKPSNSYPSRPRMASSASRGSSNSTKANDGPRFFEDRILTSRTRPYLWKISSISRVFMSRGRFPTKMRQLLSRRRLIKTEIAQSIKVSARCHPIWVSSLIIIKRFLKHLSYCFKNYK